MSGAARPSGKGARTSSRQGALKKRSSGAQSRSASRKRRKRRTWRQWFASLPTAGQVYARVRYCKFSTRQKAWSGAGSFVLAIILFVLAGELPTILSEAWAQEQRRAAVIPVASMIDPPKVGRSFGGTASDAEDEGTSMAVWLSGVKNADRVLRFGARPELSEVGPFRFRAYTTPMNATTDGSRASYLARRHLVHVSGDLDQQLVVPSVAFRFVEQFVKTRSDVIVDSFESGITPLLFAGEIARLKQELPSKMRAGFFPELAERAIWSVAAHRANGSVDAILEQWRRGEDAPGMAGFSTHSLVLPRRVVPAGVADPGPISATIASKLWAHGNPWSFLNTVRPSPAGEPAWVSRYGNAAVSAESVAAFANYFKAFDIRYRNATLASVHLTQVAQWVGEMIAPAGARATLFEGDAARVLHDYGLIPSPDWTHATAAQLSYAAVSGLAFWVRNLRFSGPYRNLNETAGPLLINACPKGNALTGGGSSLADFDELSWRPSSAPELSCLPYREGLSQPTERPPAELAAMAAGTSEVSLGASVTISSARFRSKLPVPAMQTVIDALTAGASMTPFRVTGSRVTATFTQNARLLIAAPTLASNVLDTALRQTAGSQGALFWVKQMDAAKKVIEVSAPTSPAVAAARSNIEAASRSYQSHLSSPDVSLVNSICATTYVPPQLRNSVTLSCYQVLDLAAWIAHIARANVWFPRVVTADPLTGRPAPGVLRSGPLIRVTARDALFGYEDSIYASLFGGKYPGLGPPNEDEATFAARSASSPRIKVATGASKLADVGQLRQHGPDPNGVLTWNDVSAASGAVSLKRTAGLYVRTGQTLPLVPPVGGAVSVWVEEMQRPVAFVFRSTRRSKGNHLALWGLEAQAAQEWPYQTSDRTADAPFCMRSLGRLPGPDGVPTGIKLLFGKPRFLDCTVGDQAQGYSGTLPPSNATDGSFWEVEPVTGTIASATRRWATYLRWGPTEWYPFLRPTIAQLVRVEEMYSVPEARLRAIKEAIDFVNFQVETAVPAALAVLGAVSMIQAVVFIVVIFYPPKEPVGAEEKRRRRKERIAKVREERLKKAAAEKRVLQEQRKATKLEKAIHKPGSVLMSSVLGSVASSPTMGTRGAPSFHAASMAAMSSQTAGAKVRPWQQPLASTGALAPGRSGQPTDVLSFGGRPRASDSKLSAGSMASGKDIRGMSLSQAMRGGSSPDAGDTIMVDTPDGKVRRKTVKRGSKVMAMSPKRRRAPSAPLRPSPPAGDGTSPATPSRRGRAPDSAPPDRGAAAALAMQPSAFSARDASMASAAPAGAPRTPGVRPATPPEGSPDSASRTPPMPAAVSSAADSAVHQYDSRDAEADSH